MRRLIEFIAYTIAILYFIVRYSNVDLEAPPRPAPKLPEPPAVLIPDTELPRDGIRTVTVDLEDKVQNGVGTAFAVDRAGTYVTARHVVDGCREVFLVRDRQTLEKVLSTISEGTRDFAVLRTTRSYVQPFNLSTRVPRRGDEGYMMGFPQSNPADVRATVIGRSEMRSRGRYSMREPVIAWVERERRPGFKGALSGISGGPVLDGEGQVIGTVVAGAPRRGRVYTTHPRVFEETGLVRGYSTDRAAVEGVRRTDFDRTGRSLRQAQSIAQVYCKAS